MTAEAVRSLQSRPPVATFAAVERDHSLEDGLGMRTRERHPSFGELDVLDVMPTLVADPAIEEAIRARASRYALVEPSLLAPVRAVGRRGGTLRIVSDVPAGVRLSHLLADMEFGNVTIPDASLLELAAAVIVAVARLHQLPGLVAHGAITPAHIVIARDGSVVLTDASFGGAFEALQLHREQLWRLFGVAMPVTASTHRFDQRSDVTQLAAVVLAISLRRLLRQDEYPRAVADLVLHATPIDGAQHASALRMWLQQALQLHPRSVLGTAVDAWQFFAQVLAAAAMNRRAAAQTLKEILEKAR